MERLRLWLYNLFSVPAERSPGAVRIFCFGIPLVLKKSNSSLGYSESDALKYLNSHFYGQNQLPIPKLYDAFDLDGSSYTLMSKLPGDNLFKAVTQGRQPYTEEYFKQICSEIEAVMRPIWALTQPAHLRGQVMTNANGRGMLTRFDLATRPHGPFPSRLAYYSYFTGFYDEDRLVNTLTPQFGNVRDIFDADPLVFSHLDLSMPNILVDGAGHLTGIVDWEVSGWFPMEQQWRYLMIDTIYSKALYQDMWRRMNVSEETRTAYSLSSACMSYKMW